MSFELKALIAEKPVLSELESKLSVKAVELTEQLWLLPLTKPPKGPCPYKGLVLSEPLAQAALGCSKAGPVAYVEADYAKGRDHQASIVWSKGQVSLGPLTDDTAWDPRESHGLVERPVNQALRSLGVRRSGFSDEWDAVALSRHTSTESWASK